ncbi:MAG: PQQ-like beta-propeller repeat protein [Planctomycetes bacterium]|nr:PQQ-like beta-propeller repeat protein [Planctomycetota bacterium]
MRKQVLSRIFLAFGLTAAFAAFGTEAPSNSGWPQRRGPNGCGIVVNSPKLMDTWPKEGPPLLWKSEWIPGYDEGGCGDPVMADGRVFVYASAKWPVDGIDAATGIAPQDGYRFITTELLLDAGWLPDIPEDLAKKIEEAWASKDRPSSAGWAWYDLAQSKKEGALDAFLAKKPELDKYIKDFVATLKPEDAKKYGDYIRKRLCIACKGGYGVPAGQTWDTLGKLSKLRDTRYRSRYKWANELRKISNDASTLCETYPAYTSWKRCFKWSDTVFCLDAATGKTLWRKDFPLDAAAVTKIPLEDAACSLLGACSTPAVAGDRCFVAGAFSVYCFAVKDGALLWQVPGDFAHSALLVADGVVYDNGRGCAYSAENGAVLWKNKDRPQRARERDNAWNFPVVWSSGGTNHLIVHEGDRYFACLELKTGKKLWSVKGPTGWFPSLDGDTLIMPVPWPSLSGHGFSKEYGGTKAYKLSTTGAELLWQKGFAHYEGDVVCQEHLYMMRQCVDFKTGEVNWKNSIDYTISPPLLADGKVIGQMGGTGPHIYLGGAPLIMFKATPEKYIELGRFDPQACLMCASAFSDGKLFTRLLDSVACFDLREHGIYLGGVEATKDLLTFRFRQTGGELLVKSGLNDLQIVDAAGVSNPAKAKVDGDTIAVDIKDAVAPFSVSLPAANSLSGKNGKPVPAFVWNTPRQLKVRICLDRTIILSSDLPLLPDGAWNKAGTYAVSGAKVTDVTLDPKLKDVLLTTDKAWKPGDTINLTYTCFPVEKGEPRRATLNHTVVEPQRPAATFVKMDEATLGNWKGIYGKDGAVIAGDKASAAPSYAAVKLTKALEATPWAANPKDERYLQKSGAALDRTVRLWTSEDQFEATIDLTDGKEHQVAVYGFHWGAILTVEVLNPDTGAVLNTQTVEFKDNKGRYLVWNIKGSVILRFIRTTGGEGSTAAAGGVFFDAPVSAATK